jgi:trk system potassium uptake protein TrkA
MKNTKKIKSYVVIGLGCFGTNVVKTLANLKASVLGIDVSEERVQNISQYIEDCVIADATKLNVLKELGVGKMDYAVVAIGDNLQASILTVLNLKNLEVSHITVRVKEERYKEIFLRLGVDDVIMPEEASAISFANQIMSDSILDFYPLDNEISMVKISVGENFVANKISDLNVRTVFDVNIVGIIKNEKFCIPKASDLISPGDVLLVAGQKENYTKFAAFLNK